MQPPTAPTGLAVTSRTATGFTVSWSPSSDDVGVAGYLVSLGGAVLHRCHGHERDAVRTDLQHDVHRPGRRLRRRRKQLVRIHDERDAPTSALPHPRHPPPRPRRVTRHHRRNRPIWASPSATQVSVSLMWTAFGRQHGRHGLPGVRGRGAERRRPRSRVQPSPDSHADGAIPSRSTRTTVPAITLGAPR